MDVIILKPTIMGGIDFQPRPDVQKVPDGIAQHLIEIGNARKYEKKVVRVTEKKTLSSSQAVPASPKLTVTKRKARKPKQSS